MNTSIYNLLSLFLLLLNQSMIYLIKHLVHLSILISSFLLILYGFLIFLQIPLRIVKILSSFFQQLFKMLSYSKYHKLYSYLLFFMNIIHNMNFHTF